MAPLSLWHQKQQVIAAESALPEQKIIIQEKLWTTAFTKIWFMNLALCLWSFMINATFPFYIKELGGTELLVGITAGGFAFTSLLMRPAAGWMLDNISRSGLLKGSMLGLFAVSILYLLVPMLGLVISLRWLSGFMLSGATTAGNTNACDVIPQSRFGEGIGMMGLGNTLATALGPAAGLAIMAGLGFRPLFFISLFLIFLAVVLTRGLSYRTIKRRLYLPGRYHLRWSDLFNPAALPASAVTLFASAPYGGIASFIALYGAYSGLGEGGFFFMLVAAGTGSTRLFAGKLADKKGERPLVIAGNSFFTLGLLLLLFNSSYCYYISGLCFGWGFGLSTPAMQAMSVRVVPLERRGSASSTFLSSYDIGPGIGALVAGCLVTWLGYQQMFACSLIFIAISTWIYFAWAAKSPAAFDVYKRNQSASEGASS